MSERDNRISERSKMGPASGIVKSLEEIQGFQPGNINVKDEQLLAALKKEASGQPVLARFTLKNRNLTLPQDVKDYGFLIDEEYVYYHRRLDSEKEMNWVNNLDRNNSIKIMGYYVVTPEES